MKDNQTSIWTFVSAGASIYISLVARNIEFKQNSFTLQFFLHHLSSSISYKNIYVLLCCQKIFVLIFSWTDYFAVVANPNRCCQLCCCQAFLWSIDCTVWRKLVWMITILSLSRMLQMIPDSMYSVWQTERGVNRFATKLPN